MRTKALVSIIVAVASNGAIGKNNDLMWHLPDDLQFFKEKTLGHPVIMGRKNYESIPLRFRPFRDRLNIVVTRQRDYDAPSCFLVQNLSDAIEEAERFESEEIFIIGGGQIYKEALESKLVQRMYITQVHQVFNDADVYFPQFDIHDWQKPQLLFSKSADQRNPIPFDVYQWDRIEGV
jgi:dihydrofolate reductase